MRRVLVPALLSALAVVALAAPAAADNHITPHVCTGTGGAVAPSDASPTGAVCTGGPFTGAVVHG